VRRDLPGGYELDDDPSRLDIDAIHAYIGGESYWAKGRSKERMRAAIDGSARVIGLYYGAEQVGFARVVSDRATFAYLADVYVLGAHRGRGLGVELVHEAVETKPWSGFRWYLGTLDAHPLYEKFGFGSPSDQVMQREPS
jgi:GNAT superfamily N-acetyltransferase